MFSSSHKSTKIKSIVSCKISKGFLTRNQRCLGQSQQWSRIQQTGVWLMIWHHKPVDCVRSLLWLSERGERSFVRQVWLCSDLLFHCSSSEYVKCKKCRSCWSSQLSPQSAAPISSEHFNVLAHIVLVKHLPTFFFCFGTSSWCTVHLLYGTKQRRGKQGTSCGYSLKSLNTDWLPLQDCTVAISPSALLNGFLPPICTGSSRTWMIILCT